MNGDGGVARTWRRLRWGMALTRAGFFVLSVLVLRGDGAAGIVNPHDTARPKYCLNCHTEEIYSKNCGEAEGYCLLAGSVDGICLTCHLKEDCCKVGLEHLPKLHLGQMRHPSDREIREIPRAYYPRTLPIHHGRITCRTCHLHTRERPGGYKMLRLVKVSGQAVDWSVLCRDCHKDR